MNKNYMTAVEVENEMQEYRESEEIGFYGIVEKRIVENLTDNARSSQKFGDKVWMQVPAYYVHIPSWQRNMNISRALKIANNYDKNKWEVPKLVEEGGKLVCIDGQHRLYGAYKGNIGNVVVELLDLTEKEAIDLFIGQNSVRKTMRPADFYKPQIAKGDENWIMFRDICRANNVALQCDPDLVKNPVGTFSAISEGIKTVEKSPEVFDRILKLISNLQWNASDNCFANAFGAKVFRCIKKLYAYYENDMDKMEQVLLENCKGNEFFVSNIKWREQYSAFDFLSNLVEKELKVEPIEKVTKGKKEAA